ncbi:Hypothetical_protein [Hexamita inflata]|uniref:Hypothetical_protein n=1 Tax=Hexamita inflata TaxID=28002 RepID=A0AA86TGQ6_9EUKA|nr:Hypothetical protein HINF_LOCUS3317 [Hexamita inflata]
MNTELCYSILNKITEVDTTVQLHPLSTLQQMHYFVFNLGPKELYSNQNMCTHVSNRLLQFNKVEMDEVQFNKYVWVKSKLSDKSRHWFEALIRAYPDKQFYGNPFDMNIPTVLRNLLIEIQMIRLYEQFYSVGLFKISSMFVLTEYDDEQDNQWLQMLKYIDYDIQVKVFKPLKTEDLQSKIEWETVMSVLQEEAKNFVKPVNSKASQFHEINSICKPDQDPLEIYEQEFEKHKEKQNLVVTVVDKFGGVPRQCISDIDFSLVQSEFAQIDFSTLKKQTLSITDKLPQMPLIPDEFEEIITLSSPTVAVLPRYIPYHYKILFSCKAFKNCLNTDYSYICLYQNHMDLMTVHFDRLPVNYSRTEMTDFITVDYRYKGDDIIFSSEQMKNALSSTFIQNNSYFKQSNKLDLIVFVQQQSRNRINVGAITVALDSCLPNLKHNAMVAYEENIQNGIQTMHYTNTFSKMFKDVCSCMYESIVKSNCGINRQILFLGIMQAGFEMLPKAAHLLRKFWFQELFSGKLDAKTALGLFSKVMDLHSRFCIQAKADID